MHRFLLPAMITLLIGVSFSFGASEVSKASKPGSRKDSITVKPDGKDVISKIRTQGILSDQNEESLFEEEPVVPVVKPAASRSDSGSKTAINPENAGSSPSADSTSGTALPSVSAEPGSVSAESGPFDAPMEEVAVVPTRVDSVRSINFARNLKEYKSPRIAMLLSLFLPGAGQAYAKEYLWSALFGVVEVGIIAASVGFNLKGQGQRRTAHQFADKHYDPKKFGEYYDSLGIFFREAYRLDSLPPAALDSAVQYQLDQYFLTSPEGDAFVTDLNNQAGQKNERYYSYLYEKIYVQGWTDCEPSIGQLTDDLIKTENGSTHTTASGFVYTSYSSRDSAFLFAEGTKGPDSAAVTPLYGFSPSWREYQRLIDVSNGTFKVSTNILFLLIANHIISAIDAGILATQHNNRLLGKVSVWDHIRLEQMAVNTGTEFAPGYAVRIKF